MQLIEIVQLALVGFIALSLIIFLFSYVGYRTRNRNLSNGLDNELIDDSIVTDYDVKKTAVLEPEIIEDSSPTEIFPEPEKFENKKSKFVVFKPKKKSSLKHHPKIIISSFLKESGKKR